MCHTEEEALSRVELFCETTAKSAVAFVSDKFVVIGWLGRQFCRDESRFWRCFPEIETSDLSVAAAIA
jgi:hypothetical protein